MRDALIIAGHNMFWKRWDPITKEEKKKKRVNNNKKIVKYFHLGSSHKLFRQIIWRLLLL